MAHDGSWPALCHCVRFGQLVVQRLGARRGADFFSLLSLSLSFSGLIDHTATQRSASQHR